MESENVDLNELVTKKMLVGQNLRQQLNEFRNVQCVQKIQRKINQEIKFLEKLKSTNLIKINHVMCSNLTHFELLVKVLLLQQNVKYLDHGFTVYDQLNVIHVDIVCDDGLKWIKVIARNTKSIYDAVNGCTNYGTKSILDQANEYMKAASQNLCFYQKPKIVFYFSHTLNDKLINELISYGVEVKMDLNMEKSNIHNGIESVHNDVKILNLDITTMLAYISELSNGSCNWVFVEKILTEQAKNERMNPVKSDLDKIFKGKKLICCDTALKSFNEIVSMLAGPKEKQRAEELLNRLEIYPDVKEIPKELQVLNINTKIKPRSLKIFAFGVHMKALTVTSNKGFVNSAKMQGIDIAVITHQARALTEYKEKTATASSMN